MVALGARALDDALDGERDVFGESHEEVELLVGRSTHTRSSVHGEHPQRLASPILERDDQCLLGRERIGAATLGGRCQQTGEVDARARQMTETGLQVAAGSRQTRYLDDAAQGSR